MMKKGIVFVLFLLASVSSEAGMTICNKYSCENASSYDPQEVLDALSQVFSNNKKQLVFCSANEQTKQCNNQPITFGGRTNLMSVEFAIPFARIYQVQPENDALQLVLDYQVQTNRYYPICSPSNTTLSLSLSNQGDFLLDSSNFDCRITDLGDTKMGIRFILDYLDLGKGRLGGKYQAAVRGSVVGGGRGYAVLQLSDQREIELVRRVPTAGGTNYPQEEMPALDADAAYGTPGGESKLVDWDWNNIKSKWSNFKTKFMKILYLEPLDD